MQRTDGWRRFLGKASAYNLVQNILGANTFREIYARDYIKPKSGDRILDIGCGTSEILNYLDSSIVYVGCDMSMDYIEYSRNKYGSRGEWHSKNASDLKDLGDSKFDIVLVNGLLHHLDDAEVIELLRYAKRALVEGGRLSTFDPCLVDNQNWLARFLIDRDRGKNVRTINEYLDLVSSTFNEITYSVRHDLLRVPYTHIIIDGMCG